MDGADASIKNTLLIKGLKANQYKYYILSGTSIPIIFIDLLITEAN